MIEQLSIFMENKRGAARRVLSLLAKEGVNVLGIVSSEGAEFGTLRLILSDTEIGKAALEREGYLCRTGNVIGVELPDQPGAMESLMARIDDMYIGVDYLYVGYSREFSAPVVMLHCDEMAIVEASLKKAGFTVH